MTTLRAPSQAIVPAPTTKGLLAARTAGMATVTGVVVVDVAGEEEATVVGDEAETSPVAPRGAEIPAVAATARSAAAGEIAAATILEAMVLRGDGAKARGKGVVAAGGATAGAMGRPIPRTRPTRSDRGPGCYNEAVSYRRVFGVASLAVALAACQKEPPADGEPIRPEISALPPEMRRAAESPPAAAPKAAAGEGWNDAQIAWQPYEAGLARAKELGKPACVVLYTTWCPHCRNYSHVFEDPRVVEKAKSFVMIRANADEQQAVAAKFTADGAYVPRTYFVGADGAPDPEIHAPRPKFQYFYDEHDPASLLGGMEAALRKLAK